MWIIIAAVVSIILLIVACFVFSSKELIYVYSPSCPACNDFNIEWTKIEMRTIGTRRFTSNEAKAFGIKADYVPHILKNVSYGPFKFTSVYSGSRTADAILAWYK